jgi:hypothetical protein
MPHTRSPAFLLCALLLAGCGSTPPPIPTTAAQLDFAVATGRSPNLHSGAGFAYWLWREDDGSWHLRTTSGKQSHRFQGRIRTNVPGAIQALTGVGLDARGKKKRAGGDDLKTENGEIVFDFVTKENIDGFDFQLVGSSACIDFDLRIDGDGDAGKIFIGRSATRPEKPRVVFCGK